MMKTRIFTGLLLLFGCAYLHAQNTGLPDSIQNRVPVNTDTVQTEKEPGFLKKDYPDPKKAGILSLALPGAGQLYNKRWWKLPLVYGALGGMVYLIDLNQSTFNRLQDAFEAEVAGEEHEFSGRFGATQLRNLRDEYDQRRQLSYIGFVFVYLLNGVEAFVDAHLKTFDIEDDLTAVQFRPEVIPGHFSATGGGGIGLGITINLSELGRRAGKPHPAFEGLPPVVSSASGTK